MLSLPRRSRLRSLALVALALCAAESQARAQGEPEVAPPAEPKAEPARTEPEAKPAAPRGGDTLRDMVLGHREARWRRARSELRAALGEAGFGNAKLQDAVLAFVEEQDKSREELRAVAALCSEAIRDANVPEGEIERLLGSYVAASAKAISQREAALAKLDEVVRFKTNLRLQMLLRLRGVLGSEAWLAGDALGEATDSFDLRVLYPPTQ